MTYGEIWPRWLPGDSLRDRETHHVLRRGEPGLCGANVMWAEPGHPPQPPAHAAPNVRNGAVNTGCDRCRSAQTTSTIDGSYRNERLRKVTEDAAAEISRYVWWIYPYGDVYQHATSQLPPRGGGPVTTLAGHTVDAPPSAEIPLHPFRPFCKACLIAYLALPPATPLWAY